MLRVPPSLPPALFGLVRTPSLPVRPPVPQDFVDERDAGPLYVTHFTLLLGLAVPMWLAVRLPCAPFADGASPPHQTNTEAAAWWEVAAAKAMGGNWRQQQEQQQHQPQQVAESCGGVVSLLPALAGLGGTMVIGFGDTMASVVGRAFGRIPIYYSSRKTVEGTAAGAISTLAGWWTVLLLAVWQQSSNGPAGAAVARLWPGTTEWVLLVAATAGACLLEACTSQLDNILIPLWYFPHCLLTPV